MIIVQLSISLQQISNLKLVVKLKRRSGDAFD